MRWTTVALIALLGSWLAVPVPAAWAQGAAAPDATAARSTRGRAARSTREPTAGQLAARDRIRKCGVEWKDAKAKGATGGLRWPQYYSKCNARLKGNSA